MSIGASWDRSYPNGGDPLTPLERAVMDWYEQRVDELVEPAAGWRVCRRHYTVVGLYTYLLPRPEDLMGGRSTPFESCHDPRILLSGDSPTEAGCILWHQVGCPESLEFFSYGDTPFDEDPSQFRLLGKE